MTCEFTRPHQCGSDCGGECSGRCAGRTSAHVAPAAQAAAARQPGGYPWDAITPVGGTALDDELEADLADAALGLLMTLILVSATAFSAGFVFARLFG